MNTLRRLAALVALATLAAVGTAARAEAPEADRPEACLDRFHSALESGNRDAALAELAPEVVIFESGGAELSRDEYASHHLAADMEFLAATETRILDRRSGGDERWAWVLTRTETSGELGGRSVASVGAETALLERRDGKWKIVHLHWSSRKRGP